MKPTALMVALVCSTVGGCKKTEQSSKAAPSTAPAATAVSYTSAEGRYTVAGESEAPTTKSMDDGNGAIWQTASWNSAGAQKLVQYTDYDSHERAVAEVTAFIPTRDPSAILRDQPIEIAGRKGRELYVQVNPTTTLRMRFLIDGSRVYKVGVGDKGGPELAEKFFSAFSINGASTATAGATPPATSPNLVAGMQVAALITGATKIGEATKGNCRAFADGIDSLRTQLWDLGVAHPNVLAALSDEELRRTQVRPALEALTPFLVACKDEAHAKEFAFALDKVM